MNDKRLSGTWHASHRMTERRRRNLCHSPPACYRCFLHLINGRIKLIFTVRRLSVQVYRAGATEDKTWRHRRDRCKQAARLYKRASSRAASFHRDRRRGRRSDLHLVTSTPSSPEPEARKIRKEPLESGGTPSLTNPTTPIVFQVYPKCLFP